MSQYAVNSKVRIGISPQQGSRWAFDSGKRPPAPLLRGNANSVNELLDASKGHDYTSGMKHRWLFMLLLLVLAGMAGCSPGHVGGNEIAFLRGGDRKSTRLNS